MEDMSYQACDCTISLRLFTVPITNLLSWEPGSPRFALPTGYGPGEMFVLDQVGPALVEPLF